VLPALLEVWTLIGFGRLNTRLKINQQHQLARMTNYRFSKQEVVKLLPQLKELSVDYPPELLAAQRESYLDMVIRLAAARSTVKPRRQQWRYSIMREPGSMVIKALIVVFTAFLIAFVAHSIATGNVNFEWLRELLSR
jgi:hypothetical protein